ncbi:MAG: multicopper oxidase domain-containing protein [Actinomycetota bacterium]
MLVFAAAISGLAIGFSAIDVILHLANESRNQAIEASQRAVESQLTVANDGDDIPPSGPTTVQQELGMTAGLPYRDPINLNTNTPKNLTINLVAKRTIFNIAGKKVWGESYDGQYIGPTMHFLPGENVTLHFVNDLATATNLHFHGMHLSPSGSSDNPFINVLPGHSFNYDLAIPADQPQGTFWYHDHEMCMGTEAMAMPGMAATNTKIAGCDDLESQIFAGLSGTIIVGDDRALLPTDLRNIPVHTLVFKDLQIDTSDHILQNSNTVAINSNDQTVRLVNGELRPVMTMQPGPTELWRLANEGADIFYNLQLPGYTFTVIGQDGYPSAHVYNRKYFTFASSKAI